MVKKKKTIKRQKPLPAWAHDELDSAMAAIENEHWDDARETLETINARCSGRLEMLPLLADVCAEQGDALRMQSVCRELNDLTPGDAGTLLMLAESYILNGKPVLTLRAYDEFLRLHPSHEAALKVHANKSKMQQVARDVLDGTGLSLEDEESAFLHEEISVLMGEGNLKFARQKAQLLLKRLPHFTPALNNLSQLLWTEGQNEAAIATAEQVLETSPDNIHALANLVQYSVLSGRDEDAHEWADKLKSSRATGFDVWLKKAEALSFLGDDAGVWEVWKESKRKDAVQSPGADASTAHLAAVAAWRLGREKDAREIWNAWDGDPSSQMGETLSENLDDLERPVGERHGPWPFPIQRWVRDSVANQLIQDMQAIPRRPRSAEDEDRALQNVMLKQLKAHPELEAIMPHLLERGDPKARQFALVFATNARTPHLLEALRDFALSQHGPDTMRSEAVDPVLGAELLDRDENGCVRMWMQGEWSDIILMNFNVHDEPDRRHNRSVQELMIEAIEQLQRGKATAAEPLLHRALEEYPDDPGILYNLALSYQMQNRNSEGRQILKDLFADHPDYLFGRVAMARFAVEEGELEKADKLLRPLMDRQRLHHTELSAWFTGQLELFIAQENYQAAESWLKVWEGATPQAPAIDEFRRRIKKAKRSRRVKK